MGMDISERIAKDIKKFDESVVRLGAIALSEKEREIVDMAELYARDSVAFEKDGDHYTSFASISYAHGLIDAVLKLHAK